MIEQELQKLIQAAIEMRKQSYSPYSNFAVGAAVLSNDGYIYGGCNIENASYGLTNCAERTAIFNAVSDGKRNISAIAVVADMANLKGEYKTVTLEELLPFSFSNTDL